MAISNISIILWNFCVTLKIQQTPFLNNNPTILEVHDGYTGYTGLSIDPGFTGTERELDTYIRISYPIIDSKLRWDCTKLPRAIEGCGEDPLLSIWRSNPAQLQGWLSAHDPQVHDPALKVLSAQRAENRLMGRLEWKYRAQLRHSTTTRRRWARRLDYHGPLFILSQLKLLRDGGDRVLGSIPVQASRACIIEGPMFI